MTREEAKKWFENALDNNDFFPETKDAFKVAIEALSTDKPPTIEPSGDLISRHEALMELNGACSNWQDDSKVAEIIKALPSADRPQVNSAEWVAKKEKEFEELHRPQGEDWERYSEKLWQLAYERGKNDRHKGEWINREDSADVFFLYKYECSVCGGKNVFNSSYCPNCGAEMNGE